MYYGPLVPWYYCIFVLINSWTFEVLIICPSVLLHCFTLVYNWFLLLLYSCVFFLFLLIHFCFFQFCLYSLCCGWWWCCGCFCCFWCSFYLLHCYKWCFGCSKPTVVIHSVLFFLLCVYSATTLWDNQTIPQIECVAQS